MPILLIFTIITLPTILNIYLFFDTLGLTIGIRIAIHICCILLTYLGIWLLQRRAKETLDTSQCLVPTCSKLPFKHGICKQHYDFYVGNDFKIEKLLMYLLRVYKNQLSFAENVILFIKSLIHGLTYLPMRGYEHYRLENLFTYYLYKAVKLRNIGKLQDAHQILSHLVVDFDDSQNYMLLEAKKMMHEINPNLSGVNVTDLRCEEYINNLSNLSFKPFYSYFFISLLLVVILHFISINTSVSGILGPSLVLKVKLPLLLAYALLVPVYFGINAVKTLPLIYNRLKNSSLYETNEDNLQNMNVFWKLCSSLRRKQHYDFGYKGLIFILLVYTTFYIISNLIRGDIASSVYRLLEVALMMTWFKIFMSLRLFMRTVSIIVDLRSDSIKINVKHSDAVGGLATIGVFLLNAFLMGILLYIFGFIVIPPILFTNHLPLSTTTFKILYFTIIFVVLLPFTHAWRVSFLFLKSLRRQMLSAKKIAEDKITALRCKENIIPEEVREMQVLQQSIDKFRIFPVPVNARLVAFVRCMTVLIIGYILDKVIDYLISIIRGV